MKKKPKLSGRKSAPMPSDLFAKPHGRKRRKVLFLPKYLADDAARFVHDKDHLERAHGILIRWADLEKKGHLKKKETAIDAQFLLEVFGKGLSYPDSTVSPTLYHLDRNFTVPGVGTADGALGDFSAEGPAPVGVIELKGSDTNLDTDKSNGRTAVQQCWDYLNALPACPWGIVSNFSSIRLYHRDRTPQAYEEFFLQDLRKPEVFRRFYCVFEFAGLVRSLAGRDPRCKKLLDQTATRQREVGDQLYASYSENRYQLIEHLRRNQGKSLDAAIHIAQKLLDRIIFVAFCEDRGLLPEKCIEMAFKNLPPFTKVTNPRWRNFLDLFRVVDKGHHNHLLPVDGYNGGLFRHDAQVDDLQLDDHWTQFFLNVGSYDFRDEVQVEVLGHIFEKSIHELERLRAGGLFADDAPKNGTNGVQPAMPKSAERKRFGIYYTPPEFTHFIVEGTIAAVIEQRFEALRKAQGLSEEALSADMPSPSLAVYWRDALQVLRNLKICDPACGSGAFLIEAYDALEDNYTDVVDNLRFHDATAAEGLEEKIPDMILSDNLHGVDLSEQAVEITQLALWLRSARHGKTLADLSHNIIWGNSLVEDPGVHPKAMNWKAAFPGVFARGDAAGFDCVIGNPPWERMKVQEREFFSLSAPAIANAVNAATRRKLITELEKTNPPLFASYQTTQDGADRLLTYVRGCGRYPLTGKGDVNTYSVFAELARSLVAPTGRVGVLVPSGIATDHTTKEFFAELTQSQALIGYYDFENKAPVFADVHRSFKFCVLLFGGDETKASAADFVFFARQMGDLKEKQRQISLSAKDIKLLNPNTRTCPIFRSRRDAELTKAVYRRVPILIDESREEGGNPWGVEFKTMFHQTNDAELFQSPEHLKDLGLRQKGNRWTGGKRTFLPLYEAKMIQAYDHRAASVVIREGNWVRQGQTEATSLVDHQNPEFTAVSRWWVEDSEVLKALRQPQKWGFLGFKDITSPTNERTMIAAAIPWSAVTNHFPLVMTKMSARLETCLLANLNSIILDYCARQKIGGVTLNFFIVEQLPIFPPEKYAERCPWAKRQTLEKWISDRGLKLTCTANDMRPFAEAAEFDPPVHKWKRHERAELKADLDAAFFHLYGIDREDVEYILGTFSGMGKDETGGAELVERPGLILEAYDALRA